MNFDIWNSCLMWIFIINHIYYYFEHLLSSKFQVYNYRNCLQSKLRINPLNKFILVNFENCDPKILITSFFLKFNKFISENHRISFANTFSLNWTLEILNNSIVYSSVLKNKLFMEYNWISLPIKHINAKNSKLQINKVLHSCQIIHQIIKFR